MLLGAVFLGYLKGTYTYSQCLGKFVVLCDTDLISLPLVCYANQGVSPLTAVMTRGGYIRGCDQVGHNYAP